MKQLFFIMLAAALLSCERRGDTLQLLEKRIDSLENELAGAYKPGFGELMSAIQTHHAKLWFAGKNKNWPLAAFEVKELNEVLADILKYQSERPESRWLGMISPALDSIALAVEQKNEEHFGTAYRQLTRSCNACHRQTHFEYNVVILPRRSPFTNQDFRASVPPK